MCIRRRRRRRSDTTATVFRGARAAVVSTPLAPGPRPPRARPIAVPGHSPPPLSPRPPRFRFLFFAPSRRGRRSRGCSRRARSSGLCSRDRRSRPLSAYTRPARVILTDDPQRRFECPPRTRVHVFRNAERTAIFRLLFGVLFFFFFF